MHIKTYILYIIVILLSSCTKNIVEEDNPSNVFDVFWQIMDERYVFFEEKRLNWDSIYTEYAPRFQNANENEMKFYFNQIIQYIHDSHVSIQFNSSEAAVYEYSDKRWIYIDEYLLFHYYKMFNFSDISPVTLAQMPESILYYRIQEKTSNINITGVINSLSKYDYTNGIIIDLRNNGGGSAKSFPLICPFFSGTRVMYYEKFKTGKGRSDFSDLTPMYLNGSGFINNNTPIVLLCNNNTYSAANYFSFMFKDVTNCSVIGERTGGGGGYKTSVYLPNGWILALTRNKVYNNNKQLMEYGLTPDIEVIISDSLWLNVQNITGEDPQLQAAINHLLN